MNPGSRLRAAGTTIVELVIAVAIVGTALLVLLQQLSLSYRDNEVNENRMFAWQKAMGMLAELQAGIERGTIVDASALHQLDDQEQRRLVLTTLRDEQGNELPPAHAMSGNSQRAGEWLWRRSIAIEEVPEQPRMRLARVRVWHQAPGGPEELMASISGVLNVVPPSSPPVQRFDVYVIAAGEVPGTWRSIATLRSTFETAVEDLMAASPTLRFRLHWITRLGYGRDRQYVPDLNLVTPAPAYTPSAYWYPGTLAGAERMFEPDLFTGRIRVDGDLRNDWHATERPEPHAIADQWNHCMRAPEAARLFERRVAAGLEDPEQPPLQILLDQLGREPARFEHAIFVNLHGDALPMPPLRNYSDPARDPITRPGVRVVTHPARLCTPRDPDGDRQHGDTEDLELRVYAYKTEPATGAAVLTAPITICIPDFDLSRNVNGADGGLPTTLEIRRLPGGVSPLTGLASGSDRDYAGFDSPAGLPPAAAGAPFEMWYEVGYESGAEVPYTWIRLHNTPLVAPPVGSGGLAASQRPYGYEYIPSPVVAGGGFDQDLATPGSTLPKNTARWRLRIPKSVFATGFPGGAWNDVDTMVEVATRIGTDVTTGRVWPIPRGPANLSVTFAWWAAVPSAVPATEWYQWQGDPRHNPYADLVAGGGTFPHGYNWHFDDLRDGSIDVTALWPAFEPPRLADGFGEAHPADVPRLLQLWRRLLARTGAVALDPTGAVGGALLLGGEICGRAERPGTATATALLPGSWFGASGMLSVDSVAAGTGGLAFGGAANRIGRHLVVAAGGWSQFWSKPWLGELYPDSAAAYWQTLGTLPAPAFRRMLAEELSSSATPPGTSFFGRPSGAAVGAAGTVATVGAGSLGGTFQHVAVDDGATAVPAEAADQIAGAAHAALAQALPCSRPFGTSLPFAGNLPHFAFLDSYQPAELDQLELLHAYSSSLHGGAILKLFEPDEARSLFRVVHGTTPRDAAEDGETFRSALLGALRAKHRGGAPDVGAGDRITQLPRLTVEQPLLGAVLAKPASIMVRWNTEFVRFDGQPYTPAYPTPFAEREADLLYVLLYSADNGATWLYAATHAPATPGERPTDPSLLLPDAASGTETFLWSATPEQLPAADYRLRVDCHHATRHADLAYHETRFTITR